MQLADKLVIVRQGLYDFASLLEFLVHPFDLRAVACIGHLRRNPAQRDVQRLDIALQGEADLRRRHGGFLNGLRHDCGKAGSRIGDEFGDRITHRVIETRRRVGHAFLQVVMVDERVVVGVRQCGAFQYHVGNKAGTVRDLNVRVAIRLDHLVDHVAALGN